MVNGTFDGDAEETRRQLLQYCELDTFGYGKGTSFTKLKGHRLHFLKTNFLSKIRNYALERNDNYGTKSRIYL